MKNITIETPCKAEVEKYLFKLEHDSKLEAYREKEKVLNKAFLNDYKHNDNITDVLLKTTLLNDFYSTNILDVYPVAKSIVSKNIDDRLNKNDESLVNDIAKVTMANNAEKNFYSFATKYCSHHKPNDYPIYDDYVSKLLAYFKNNDKFTDVKVTEFKQYSQFKKAVLDFIENYNLKDFSKKEIDHYMWLKGKEVFPKKYYNKKPQSTPTK